MYDESVFRPVWLREWYSWSKVSWSNDEVDVPCALWEEHTFPRGTRLDASDDSLLVSSGDIEKEASSEWSAIRDPMWGVVGSESLLKEVIGVEVVLL